MKKRENSRLNIKFAMPLLAGVAIVGGLLFVSPDATAQIDAGLGAAGAGMEQGADIDGTVGNFVNLFLYVVGVVAVIMIIYGGFQFLTSAGDSSKAGKARSTILYALIGLIVAALAYAIINFVMDEIVA